MEDSTGGQPERNQRQTMNNNEVPQTAYFSASPGPAPVASGPGFAHNPYALMVDNIVQAARQAIITVDENQHIVMINPAAQRLFGCSAADALGDSLGRFIPTRHRKAHAAQVRQFDQAGTSERPMGERSRVVGLRADGKELPLDITISRLDVIDSLGPRRFFTALICDLSEINRLRDDIDSLNQRLRDIFEMAPIAIWIIDSDLIVFANRACATLFGAAKHQDLVGRSIYSLLGPQAQISIRRAVEQALTSEKPVSAGSEKLATLDGAVREVEIAVAALPDHGRTTVQMVITDITRMTQERRTLERSRQELRQLSASLVDAREEERRRIARELHDELGQRLTALHMELSNLIPPGQDAAISNRIKTMLGMVDDTVASVRRIATELRPLMLDDLGLASAVEWLADGWAKRMGIRVTLDMGADDPTLSEAQTIALYRMVQEALTNVARHAKATKVKIRMRKELHELVLTVRDNGVGFSEELMHREGTHGLMGIRERADMLGGQLEIGNARGGGGCLTVRLPAGSAAPSGTDTVAAARRPPPSCVKVGSRGKARP